MSVLPRSRTGSSQVEAYQRKRTDVVGTAAVPLGYKLRQQTIGVKCPQPKIHRQSSGISSIFGGIDDTPRYANALDRKGAENPKGSLLTGINSRRERLRTVLSSEEASLAKEILDMPPPVASKPQDSARDQLQLQEEQLRHLVVLKRKQQYFENCPEVRERVSREIAKGVKVENLKQIVEKSLKLKQEKELDKLWFGLMVKEEEAQKRREEDERRKKKIKEKETGEILTRQMEAKSISGEELKRRREEERQELEKLWELVREEEVKALEVERLKREKLRKGLEEQLIEARSQFEERSNEERKVAEKLKFISKVEAEEEKKRIKEAKIKLQKEIDGYMKFLDELKSEQMRREDEVDAIIEESARDIEVRRELARKRYKERQEKFKEEILKVRDNQIRAKKEFEAEERRKIEEEREIWRKEAVIAEKEGKDDVCKKKESAVKYRRELQAQLERQEVEKMKEIEEENGKEKKVLKEREEFEKFKEELDDFVSGRAFRVRMEECEPARKFF